MNVQRFLRLYLNSNEVKNVMKRNQEGMIAFV